MDIISSFIAIFAFVWAAALTMLVTKVHKDLLRRQNDLYAELLERQNKHYEELLLEIGKARMEVYKTMHAWAGLINIVKEDPFNDDTPKTPH
jgi:hypothetical protein